MQCPNCLNTVPDIANVCGYCGQRLKVPAQTPSPELAAPKQSVSTRLGYPKWGWGLMSALVFLAAGYVYLVFKPGDSADSPPMQDTQPPATQTAQLVISAPLVETKARIASPSPAPTKGLSMEGLPQGVSEFLIGAKILETDDFSTRSELWGTSDSGVTWSDRVLKIEGIQTFATYLGRGPVMTTGKATLFRFTYKSKTVDVNFFLDQGEFQTDEYRRFGVNLQDRAFTTIFEGRENLSADNLSGDLVFEQGKQYFILLALDGEREFAAVLWDAGDPGMNLLYRSGRMPDLPNEGWYLVIQSNNGTLELDAYYLIEFSEFMF